MALETHLVAISWAAGQYQASMQRRSAPMALATMGLMQSNWSAE